MSAKVATEVKAKRGDLLVIERTTRDYVIGQETVERRLFEMYEVAGLFRDGRVRSIRSVAWTGSATQDVEGKRRMLGLVTTYLLPAANVDKEAVTKAVQAHTYPNSSTPMPFDSIDELRALVKPFRREVPA